MPGNLVSAVLVCFGGRGEFPKEELPREAAYQLVSDVLQVRIVVGLSDSTGGKRRWTLLRGMAAISCGSGNFSVLRWPLFGSVPCAQCLVPCALCPAPRVLCSVSCVLLGTFEGFLASSVLSLGSPPGCSDGHSWKVG